MILRERTKCTKGKQFMLILNKSITNHSEWPFGMQNNDNNNSSINWRIKTPFINCIMHLFVCSFIFALIN